MRSPSPSDPAVDAPLAGVRALFVVGTLELGGAERQAIDLARALRDHDGCEVEMWSFGGDGLGARLCETSELPWRVLPSPWLGPRWQRPLRLRRFRLDVRAWRPDVILAYTTPPNVACGLTWRQTGAAAFIWNQRDAGRRDAVTVRTRRAATAATMAVSNAACGASFLTDDLGVPADRVRVSPNGVELAAPALARDAWRERHGLPARDFVATMIANLTTWKDHATLLRAWRRLHAESTGDEAPPRLLLAGADGDAATAVDADIARLRLRDVVRRLGQVHDVSSLLHAVDMLVHVSPSEGCPNAVIEGMAAGLPVVATESPGVRETLGDAADASLVPAGDDAALAARIHALAADPARRRALGDANRRAAATRFDPGLARRRFAGFVAEAMDRAVRGRA